MTAFLPPKRFEVSNKAPSNKLIRAVASTGVILLATVITAEPEQQVKIALLASKTISPLTSSIAASAPVRLDIRNAGQHLNGIRETLDPPMSELASFFDVSRQCLYKWSKESSEPEASNLKRIHALSAISSKFQAEHISQGWNLLTMKVFGGLSLLDNLKAGTDTPEQLSTLIAEAKVMKADYENAIKGASNTAPTDDWKSSDSIPGGFESV